MAINDMDPRNEDSALRDPIVTMNGSTVHT